MKYEDADFAVGASCNEKYQISYNPALVVLYKFLNNMKVRSRA